VAVENRPILNFQPEPQFDQPETFGQKPTSSRPLDGNKGPVGKRPQQSLAISLPFNNQSGR
jgi:hypothetical protein